MKTNYNNNYSYTNLKTNQLLMYAMYITKTLVFIC